MKSFYLFTLLTGMGLILSNIFGFSYGTVDCGITVSVFWCLGFAKLLVDYLNDPKLSFVEAEKQRTVVLITPERNRTPLVVPKDKPRQGMD